MNHDQPYVAWTPTGVPAGNDSNSSRIAELPLATLRFIASRPASSRTARPGRPAITTNTTAFDVDAAVAEIERLYDTAALVRTVPDGLAPDEVAARVRALLAPGRYRLLTDLN